MDLMFAKWAFNNVPHPPKRRYEAQRHPGRYRRHREYTQLTTISFLYFREARGTHDAGGDGRVGLVSRRMRLPKGNPKPKLLHLRAVLLGSSLTVWRPSGFPLQAGKSQLWKFRLYKNAQMACAQTHASYWRHSHTAECHSTTLLP